MLVVNQFFAAITGSEAWDFPSPMLADSAYQIVGHTNVKNGAMFIAHDVDPEIVIACRRAIFTIRRKAGETYILS